MCRGNEFAEDFVLHLNNQFRFFRPTKVTGNGFVFHAELLSNFCVRFALDSHFNHAKGAQAPQVGVAEPVFCHEAKPRRKRKGPRSKLQARMRRGWSV